MLLFKLVLWFIDKLVGQPPRTQETKEQEIGVLSQFYETPAVQRYLDERERYLIDTGIERFIEGKLTDTRGLAGQLIEVRSLRAKLQAAWAYTQRKRKERALATETTQ